MKPSSDLTVAQALCMAIQQDSCLVLQVLSCSSQVPLQIPHSEPPSLVSGSTAMMPTTAAPWWSPAPQSGLCRPGLVPGCLASLARALWDLMVLDNQMTWVSAGGVVLTKNSRANLIYLYNTVFQFSKQPQHIIQRVFKSLHFASLSKPGPKLAGSFGFRTSPTSLPRALGQDRVCIGQWC